MQCLAINKLNSIGFAVNKDQTTEQVLFALAL